MFSKIALPIALTFVTSLLPQVSAGVGDHVQEVLSKKQHGDVDVNAPYGAGVQAWGCIYNPQPQNQDVKYNFITTGASSKCMTTTGHDASLYFKTNEVGVLCVSLGYVESKASGICAFEDSNWSLSWKGSDGTSGHMMTGWHMGSSTNHVNLKGDNSPGCSICDTDAHCTSNKIEWKAGSAPNIYFEFEPSLGGYNGIDFGAIYDKVWRSIDDIEEKIDLLIKAQKPSYKGRLHSHADEL